ncbi:MAG: hypothetical protein EBV40_07675, partial [Actinobacteria bacterium]|nr:hypothetical protein [Actinomycetota bacterium]
MFVFEPMLPLAFSPESPDNARDPAPDPLADRKFDPPDDPLVRLEFVGRLGEFAFRRGRFGSRRPDRGS